jgi:DNA-binding NtrC family response regulator
MNVQNKTNIDPLILLVDDEAEALMAMELALNMAGYSNIRACKKSKDALQIFQTEKIDLAVLDIYLPDVSGTDILHVIKEKDETIQVIMATGVNEVETAIHCIKQGAFDYIVKPMDSDRFVSSVQNALRIRELQKENSFLAAQLLSTDLKNPQAFSAIYTQDEKMKMIFKYVEAIAPTSHPVLITGETGVGKELIARSLHTLSNVSGNFIAVNVAEIDDAVFSDTLFGHTKGAFTGADTLRKGLVESAAGGTLFLDEIGDMSPQSQIKLLRLLQEHEYRSVGSDIAKRSNARIITATCKSLETLRTSESFRKDLFYRLHMHHINLPPLRLRKGDLEMLTKAFLAEAAQEMKKNIPAVPNELWVLLRMYHFPGNVRELRSMVFDAMSTHVGSTLSLNRFKAAIGIVSGDEQNSSIQEMIGVKGDQKISFSEQLPTLKEMEDLLIEEVLQRTNGNQSLASAILGITRQALGQRLKRKNI